MSGKSVPEKSFQAHLGSYLVIIVGLFIIDVASGNGWWFYWPMIGWGIAVALHGVTAWTTRNPNALADSTRDLQARASAAARKAATAPTAPSPQPDTPRPHAATPAQVEERVARLWRMARSIPVPSAREKAFAVCAAADRVAEVLAADRRDPETASWFIETYLKPAESLLQGYARVASRGVAGADATLAKVEQHDLPRLEEQIDKVYQQLHQGDVIDLAVTSEMLDFSLPDQIQPPTRTVRGRAATTANVDRGAP